MLLTRSTAFVWRLAVDGFFDAIQLADPTQRLSGQRCWPCRMQIIKFAPGVRPLSRLDHASCFVDGIKAGVGIGLQEPWKVAKCVCGCSPLRYGD